MSRTPRPSLPPERLRRRADYLAAAKGRRHHSPRMSLQAAERTAPGPSEAPRFGLTVSRKVGNAVKRNRVKRRLRAALRLLAAPVQGQDAPALGQPRFDYVVVARSEAIGAPFESLLDDLRHGLAAVHAPRGARSAGKRPGLPAAGRHPARTGSPDRSPESH